MLGQIWLELSFYFGSFGNAMKEYQSLLGNIVYDKNARWLVDCTGLEGRWANYRYLVRSHVMALVTGHVPCGSTGCASETVTRDTGTRGHGDSKPRWTSPPSLRIPSPFTWAVTKQPLDGCMDFSWRGNTWCGPSAFPFIFLNRLVPTVAYSVNLSIYWRLWSLSGGQCRTNKDLQKRPLLIVWREDTMQKMYLFPVKQREYFSVIPFHSQVWRCQVIFNKSLCTRLYQLLLNMHFEKDTLWNIVEGTSPVLLPWKHMHAVLIT